MTLTTWTHIHMTGQGKHKCTPLSWCRVYPWERKRSWIWTAVVSLLTLVRSGTKLSAAIGCAVPLCLWGRRSHMGRSHSWSPAEEDHHRWTGPHLGRSDQWPPQWKVTSDKEDSDWDDDTCTPAKSQFEDTTMAETCMDMMQEPMADSPWEENVVEASVGLGSQDVVQIHTSSESYCCQVGTLSPCIA